MFIFPSADALPSSGATPSGANGALIDPAPAGEITRWISVCKVREAGSSTRVARAIVLTEPPSIGEGKITAKGTLRFGQVLARRAGLVERLYKDDDPAVIRVAGE